MNRSTSYKRSVWFCLLSLFILCLFPIDSVSAQQAMTGGTYTLQGGVTSVTGSGSGGTYTLNPSGDPIINQSSGGSYTLTPTPFNISSGSSGGSSGSSGGSSGGGQSGAGYTEGTSTVNQMNNYENGESGAISQNQNNQSNWYKQSKYNYPYNINDRHNDSPILFRDDKNIPGVEWIDEGEGVDINLDGKKDLGSAVNKLPGAEINISEDAKDIANQWGITLKKYANSLTTFEIVVLLFFLLLYVVLPVVRGKNPRLVSFALWIILVNYLLATYKNQKVRDVQIRNTLRNIGGESDKYYFEIHIVDAFVLPAFLIFASIYIWSISPVISIIFIGLIFVRILVGQNLKKNV